MISTMMQSSNEHIYTDNILLMNMHYNYIELYKKDEENRKCCSFNMIVYSSIEK